MSRYTLAALLVALSFLGIADSWYLAESALTNTPLTCNISGLDGCNIVAQSSYSHLFGVPLGVYGVVFYSLIFALGVLVYVLPKRFLFHILSWIGTIGLVASIIFLGIQFFVIKALCIYCLGSALIALLVFIISFWLLKHHAPKHPVVIPGL